MWGERTPQLGAQVQPNFESLWGKNKPFVPNLAAGWIGGLLRKSLRHGPWLPCGNGMIKNLADQVTGG